MKNTLLVLAVLFLMTGRSHAQDFEVEPSDTPVMGTILRESKLFEFPNTQARVFPQLLQPGAVVELIGTTTGWQRIRAGQVKGWTASNNLPSLMSKRFDLSELRKPPCKNSIAACPLWGCPNTKDSPAGLMNSIKHGPPRAGQAKPIILPQGFTNLQKKAEVLVGEQATLDPEDRAKLRTIYPTLGEGDKVVTLGYLVGKAHPNTGESVNCGLTDAPENDIHLTIAASPQKDPHQGIVAEIIPQGRNPKWTINRLNKLGGHEVMVVGQLFYDNVHHINPNPRNNLGGQPPRFSLWEVHPITEFYVCGQGTCDPSDKTQWTPLDKVPE